MGRRKNFHLVGLDEVKAKGSYALARYSYVSLFGVNSLEALKLALFENLDFLDTPPESFIENTRRMRARTRRREMTGPYRARNPLLVGALYIADGIAALSVAGCATRRAASPATLAQRPTLN
jgi:hypothetical protein